MISVKEFDHWARDVLPFTAHSGDRSLNGLQVSERSDKELHHVCFALDACEASIRQAAELGADMLFVHHGFFWGAPLAVKDSHYRRIKFLMEHNISLYAVHLPLDSAPLYGNNYTVAKRMGCETLTGFASIGYQGRFTEPQNIFALAEKVYGTEGLTVWPFKNEVSSAAVIVGGAARMIHQVQEEQIDCFITGEISHEIYHFCAEEEISLIACGHYQSEMYGLKAFMAHVQTCFPTLKTTLIEIPTGC